MYFQIRYTKFMFIATIFTLILINKTLESNCFNTWFPRIMGGLKGYTNFLSMDIDLNNNFVIGGGTND